MVVSAVIAALARRRRPAYIAAFGAVATVVMLFAGMTMRGTSVWHDSLALWSHGVRKSPDDAGAHETLGLALIRSGRECEGRRELRAALRLEPDRATNSLASGVLAARNGLRMQAVLSFQTALLYNPELVEAHYNLALAFEQLGWTEAAIDQYRATLDRNADHADAHNNLGILLAQLNALDEAIAHFEAAVRIRPNDPELHSNLARAYTIKGRSAEAAEQGALAAGRTRPPMEMRSSHPFSGRR